MSFSFIPIKWDNHSYPISLGCCEGHMWKTVSILKFYRGQRFVLPRDQILFISFPKCLPDTAQNTEIHTANTKTKRPKKLHKQQQKIIHLLSKPGDEMISQCNKRWDISSPM